MPTIYEIAKKAGVAPGTVSKVFNNYRHINEKTKENVLRIAKEMGYIPNAMAQALTTNHSFLVGVIFSEGAGIGLDHPFFSRVLESFRHRIGSYGYDTVFINNRLGNKEIGYLDHCKYRSIDGAFIITVTAEDMEVFKQLDDQIKCVTSDVMLEHIPYVMSDNEKGGQMAVEYLFKMGHRRIGHIAGPLSTISAGERFKGYEAGLVACGIQFQQPWLGESRTFEFKDAYELTLKYLERFNKEHMPTALTICSDVMTLGVIAALSEKGYKIPNDFSVIGFDDINTARLVTPQLTTIRQDTKAIGENLADILYNRMNNKEVPEVIRRVPVELIVRHTVKQLDT